MNSSGGIYIYFIAFKFSHIWGFGVLGLEGDEEETNMLEMEEAMSIFDDSPPINLPSSLAPTESQQVQTASKTNTV